MNTVKTLYTSRDITNIKTAKSALELLNSNTKTDFNTFSKKFSTIMHQATKKDVTTHIKRQRTAMKEDEEDREIIRVVDNKIYKPKVKIQFGETEAPSFDIEFLRTYRMFEESGDGGVKKLIKLTENHM